MENLLDAAASDESGSQMFNIVKLLTGVKEENFGFELLRWTSPNKAPRYVTKNGFGNGAAYGIRNFTLAGDDLYIGSASPFNLHKYGGWHLFRLHSDAIGTSVETATTKELLCKHASTCNNKGIRHLFPPLQRCRNLLISKR